MIRVTILTRCEYRADRQTDGQTAEMSSISRLVSWRIYWRRNARQKQDKVHNYYCIAEFTVRTYTWLSLSFFYRATLDISTVLAVGRCRSVCPSVWLPDTLHWLSRLSGSRSRNTLPLNVTSASSLTAFNLHLKLHLFCFSFPGLSPVWLLSGPCSVRCHLGHCTNFDWLTDWFY